MGKVYLHNTVLNDIANAIREKTADNGHTYNPSEFAAYITAIDREPTSEPLVSTVTSQLVTVEDSTLTAIANAIRSKLGSNLLYYPKEMPDLIRSIPFNVTPAYDPWQEPHKTNTAAWWDSLKVWVQTATEEQKASKVGTTVSPEFGNSLSQVRCIGYNDKHLIFERVWIYPADVPFEMTKTGDPVTEWNNSSVKAACDSYYNEFVGKSAISPTDVNFFVHGENIIVPTNVFILSYAEMDQGKSKYYINNTRYVEDASEPYQWYVGNANGHLKYLSQTDYDNYTAASYWIRNTGGRYIDSIVGSDKHREWIDYLYADPKPNIAYPYQANQMDLTAVPNTNITCYISPAFSI